MRTRRSARRRAPHYPLEAPDHLIAKYNNIFDYDKFAVYAAMVEQLDAGIGRVLDVLDELKLADNTLVVFTSDNGPSAEPKAYGLKGARISAGPLRDHKFSLHEGGIRVPFLACWPGRIPANASSDELAATMDLFPTFLEAVGIKSTSGLNLDGVSMLPLLEGKAGGLHDRVHWETDCMYAVAKGDWKLVRALWLDEPFLYNLKTDLGEHRDLSENHPETVAELVELHRDWQQTYFPNPFPRPTKRPRYRFPEE